MKTFYLTDAGRVRSHNEDSVTILKNASNEYLLMVADGMGGHRAGEVASSLAVTHMGKRFSHMASIGSKLDAVNWLNDNASEINNEIIEYAKVHPETTGLGTTLVLAILTKEYLIFGNIGDSTGFVLKNGHLHQVTKPHSLVNLLVEAGQLTEEEAKYHPKKNVLMKALGAMEKVELDIFDVDLTSEAILLCSDGLTNMLTTEQIEKVLNDESLEMEEKVIKLIRKSNARGGQDNISVAYLVIKESGDTNDNEGAKD
ncbi:MAG: Stp1/IreP family PP2C-type Ser/Thr phosphatase [Bacilli bacterium]|jgi:protein phosphatase|nr:Stp1/IreP family PP2C-type Ser/Thr phosphatase [Bacilli bacterium]